jgi:acetyl esterase/lipase
LFLVHGGGWNTGDKAEFAPYALRAADQQKWAVFDVNYRLAPTDPAAWPDELHDIQAAIRFVASNAQRFGIDPQQVVAIGESAGANLIALIGSKGTANPVADTAVGENPTLAVPIRAVGLWSPPVDLAGLYAASGQPPPACGSDQACDFTWSQGAIGEYFGCDPAACPTSYSDASPTTWVSVSTAPSFVVNSSQELVPVDQVQRYVAALQAAEVPVQFTELPGSLHAIQYGEQVWPQTVSYLQQQLAARTAPSTTMTPGAAPSTSEAPTPADDAEHDDAAAWPWVVGIGLAALAGAVVAVFVRARRRSGDGSDEVTP